MSHVEIEGMESVVVKSEGPIENKSQSVGSAWPNILIMRDGDDESITTVNITTVHGSNDSLESRSLPFNVQSFPPERLVQRSSSVTFSKQKLTSFLSSPPRFGSSLVYICVMAISLIKAAKFGAMLLILETRYVIS
ncbi:hypothetical protein F2Q69_00002709 [Brassica cretica]|uniref:Uncharacterized protein n=1 Tax=Brassica cretica TaxID=69181 RepID=A0A8S9P5I1_BRACR|nr:hypothetical protein F2Q69_00002709 [Brassica cretica]